MTQRNEETKELIRDLIKIMDEEGNNKLSEIECCSSAGTRIRVVKTV